MDEHNRRKRQNEPPYSGSDPRFNAGQAHSQGQGRGFSSSSTDRYRTGTLTASPTAGRGSGAAAGYSTGYYQEPQSSFPAAMPANAMQYQPGYPQDQRQQQGFPTYNPELMYNVAQQTPQANVYDSSQQFQPRQPAAMQMLSDVAAPYFPNEPTSAPGPPGLHHQASSSSSTAYQHHQQSPVDRAPMLPPGYTSGMTMGGMPQPSSGIVNEEEFQTDGPGMEEAYTAYQTALKEIFQNIINNRLAAAGQSLLEVSEWLLGHVGDLGLTVDEVTLHSDRIRLWGEFNTAWLSIFQKQKDLLEAGQRSIQPQTLMTQEFITKMGKDLIRMCDAVEKHGLVDYQYGVAEEQIMMILEECLDTQISIESGESGNSGSGRVPP